MSSEAQKAKAPTKARIWILAGLCIIAGLLWSANWYFVSKFVSDEKQGQFGDMFGAVNALFTALAFAGLIYTVLLQRDQLALQQQEIVESGKTQEQLVQRQIDAQDKLFERQKAFQEEQRQKQIAHELKLEELRQNFEDLVERRRKDRGAELAGRRHRHSSERLRGNRRLMRKEMSLHGTTSSSLRLFHLSHFIMLVSGINAIGRGLARV